MRLTPQNSFQNLVLLNERTSTVLGGEKFRYGFNGKESDNELSGEGNHYDYGFRIYNPRLGRFLSLDPLSQSFPWYTPYQFAGNMPTIAIDLDGLEEWIVIQWTVNNVIVATSITNVAQAKKCQDAQYNGTGALYFSIPDPGHEQSKSTADKSRTSAVNVLVKNSEQKKQLINTSSGKYVPEGLVNAEAYTRDYYEARGWGEYYKKFTNTVQTEMVEPTGKTISIKGSVLTFSFPSEIKIEFDVNSAILPKAIPQELKAIGETLRMLKDSKVTLIGHTDSDGSPESNQKLSLDRAKAVRDYLINIEKVDPQQILSFEGKGESELIMNDSGQEDKSRSRRMQVKVTESGITNP